ncbi:MAG: lipoprotein signal peptidase [Tatlockia sp.]|nr:lipoprotein signal peptidase [Tatlockia sp.]
MKKWPWFLLSIFVVVIDQLTKYWAEANLVPYQPEAVFSMFNFTLAYNTGAAFSFLSGVGSWHRWFFAGFSIAMSLVLTIWLIRLSPKAKLQSLAISLILGGAVGNLYDRAAMGHVIDFIDLYYENHHWPVFNLADAAICLGAFLLLIDMGFSHQTETKLI